MEKKTKGQIEAKISETMMKFEKEFMGRGPEEAKTWILKDLILVRLRGVLTPAEERLTKTPQGREFRYQYEEWRKDYCFYLGRKFRRKID